MGRRHRERRQRKSVDVRMYNETEDEEFNSASNVPYAVLNLAKDRQHLKAHPNIDGSGRGAIQDMKMMFARQRSEMGLRSGSARPLSGASTMTKSSKKSGLTIWGRQGSAISITDDTNQLGMQYKNFMKNNFSMYEACVDPVKNPKNASKCLCGRELRILEHAVRKDSTTTTWAAEENCASAPLTTYGLVIFRTPRSSAPGMRDTYLEDIGLGHPFVRVTKKTCIESPHLIRELLVEKWDLESPRVLLAVTGGATTFNLPPKLDMMIRVGLAKAASSKSMWITSGGTNTGVMKYVGEAIASSNSYVPMIGFIPWSIVRGKDVLTTYPDGQPVDGGLVYYGDPDIMDPPFMALDRNHTHFIIVDDGTEGNFGGEIEARAQIESSLCDLESHGEFGTESPISTVLLAIQGGPGTVKTIYENLVKDVPVVIVEGSGKACNVIAFAMNLPKKGERVDPGSEYTEENFNNLIMNEFQVREGSPVYESVRSLALKCVADKHFCSLLHVYCVDYSGAANESLDYAIMQAVLQHDELQWDKWSARKSKSGVLASVNSNSNDGGVGARIRRRDLTRVLRLEMALMWNRIEVVKQEVSQYTILPGLANMNSSLMYMVKSAGAGKYISELNGDVALKEGDQVELLRMRGSGVMWLVRHIKSDSTLWIKGSSLTRDVSKPSFADSVVLAHMKMLTFLMIDERLPFVELFLQGMRTKDAHAFLSLSTSEIWDRAARYNIGSEVKRRERIDEFIASPVVPTSPSPEKQAADLDHRMMQISPSNLEVPVNSRVILGTPPTKQRKSSRFDSQRKIQFSDMLDSILMFDDSDVQLPGFIDATMIKMVADARLATWRVKKKNQREIYGFELSDQTTEILLYLDSIRHPDMLSGTEDEVSDREEWSVWFLKYLYYKGYQVAHVTNGKQLGVRTLDQIPGADDLVEGVADAMHSKWLTKKYESGWVHGPKYSSKKKTSPFIRFYDALSTNDREFNLKCARTLVSAVCENGLWIWHPDVLESLYLYSLDRVHLYNRFNGGAVWRTQILAMIADIAGTSFTSDFTTFNALDPYFHLMVWSLLTQRFDLAHWCWEQRPESAIVNAYFGAMICTFIQKDKSISPETRDDFDRQNHRFRELALGIISECTHRDSKKTKRLLAAQYESAGWMSLLDMAYQLKDTKVTSMEIFIEVMKSRWYGKVSQHNNFIKYSVAIILPVPALMLYNSDRSQDVRRLFSKSGLHPSTSTIATSQNRPVGSTSRVVLRSHLGKIWRLFFDRLSVQMDHDDLYTASAPVILFNGLVHVEGSPKGKNDITGTIQFRCGTKNANIFYTLDGTDPDADYHALKYDGSPIFLRGARIHTIKAFAQHPLWRKPQYVNSGITFKQIDTAQVDPEISAPTSFVFGPKDDGSVKGRYSYLRTVTWRIHTFFDSPFTIFFFYLLNSLTYTLLYSYTAIVTTTTLDVVLEMDNRETLITVIVYGWTITLISDEFRQIGLYGIERWWSNSWNRIDTLSYTNTVVSAVLRAWNDLDTLLLSRTLYALGAMILWLRVARMYGINRDLGPKLMMIKEMLADVMIFVALLGVVLVGYGVTMHAILEPDRTFDTESFTTILYRPTFNAIGETFLAETQAQGHCLGEDFTMCDDISHYLILLLLTFYLLISNILLVNLLIAMMAQTYGEISEKANEIWSLQNINLLVEFRELRPLPPPLNLLNNIIELLAYSLRWIIGSDEYGNQVGPNGKMEICDVSPYLRMSEEDTKFVKETTVRYLQLQQALDKEEVTRRMLTDLIDKRLSAVDNKLKDLEYELRKHLRVTSPPKVVSGASRNNSKS